MTHIPPPNSRVLLATIAGLTAVVFLVDAASQLGLAIWVFYLIPLALTSRLPGTRPPLWHATVVTPLIILGFLLSPGPPPTIINYLNRLIALGAIWGGAALTWRLQVTRSNLEERSGQLRLFIEHSTAAVAMFDRQMHYLAASQQWLKDYRLEAASVAGASHYEIFPDLPEAWREVHHRGLAGEIVAADRDRFDRADGSVQFLRWEVRPWYLADGQVGGIIIFTEDITQELTDRQAIEGSEERLRLAMNAARMGSFDWEIPAGRIAWNPWHEALWGFQPGEFDGTYAGFASRVHPDDLTALNERIDRCRTSRLPYSHEYRVIWPDGSMHWMLGHAQFSYADDGTATGMRGVVMEVTERKHQEEALAQAADQLARLSAKLDGALEEERARLSREIHDELGQLLTGIKMDLRWVERRLDREFPVDVRLNPVIDRLVAAGELADQLIDSIQRIATELRPAALDSFGLGMAVEQESDRFATRTGIRTTVHLPQSEPSLPSVTATALFRILQEALTNVARHAGAASVTITLTTEGDCCRLSVQDDGRGATTPDATARNALGLLGMRERARLVHGTVEFTTTPGEGFTVTAQAPLTPANAGAA